MPEVLAVVVAAVLAGFGFLARRLRRDRSDEVIARRLKLVALYQRMRSAKLDVESLERLEQELGNK